MQSIAHLEFVEPDDGDVLYVGIWVTDTSTVGIALSLERDGDLQVFFQPNQLVQVMAALTTAEAAARLGLTPGPER